MRFTVEVGVPHVWIVDVESPSFLEVGRRADLVSSGLVSEADDARASAFRDPATGVRLRARRAFLRMALAGYLGCAPEGVGIVTAPGGKPVLLPGSPGAATHAFSVGHSGALYVIAVGTCSSIGCDIEKLRTVPRATAIADRWFGRAEAALLDGLDGDHLDLAFVELWTDKEALAKRHGAGLRLMKGQSEDPEVHDELDIARESEGGRLVRLRPRDGYVGALASTETIQDVKLIQEGDPGWII